MNAKRLTLVIAAALVAAAPLAAAAGPAGDDKPRAHGKMKAERRGETAAMADFQPALCRADALLGATVRNGRGEEIGTVDDLIVDPRHHGVTDAVVAFGGFLGLNEKQRLVSFGDLRLERTAEDPERFEVRLDMTEAELENTMVFDAENWTGVTGGEDGGHALADTRRVANLLAGDARGTADRDLGEVEDILIDTNRGHLAYLVLDVDRQLLDLGEDELAAVPWTAVQPAGDRLRVATGTAALADMGWRAGALAELEDRAAAEQRHRHAGLEPYWQTVIAVAPATDRPEATRYGSRGPDGGVIQGRIAEVSVEKEGNHERLRLQVRTEEGHLVTVDAGKLGKDGPQTRETLQVGDRVTDSGNLHPHGKDGRLVKAASINHDGRMITIGPGR